MPVRCGFSGTKVFPGMKLCQYVDLLILWVCRPLEGFVEAVSPVSMHPIKPCEWGLWVADGLRTTYP